MITMFMPPPAPRDEAAREAAVLASGLMHADVGWRLHDFVLQARQAVGTGMAALTIIYRDRQLLVATAGLAVGRTSRATSFCGHAIVNPNELMCVPDTSLDPRFAENPNVLDDPFIRFYAGAPLTTAEGLALGTLCVFDSTPRPRFDATQASYLRDLASQIMHYARR